MGKTLIELQKNFERIKEEMRDRKIRLFNEAASVKQCQHMKKYFVELNS